MPNYNAHRISRPVLDLSQFPNLTVKQNGILESQLQRSALAAVLNQTFAMSAEPSANVFIRENVTLEGSNPRDITSAMLRDERYKPFSEIVILARSVTLARNMTTEKNIKIICEHFDTSTFTLKVNDGGKGGSITIIANEAKEISIDASGKDGADGRDGGDGRNGVDEETTFRGNPPREIVTVRQTQGTSGGNGTDGVQAFDGGSISVFVQWPVHELSEYRTRLNVRGGTGGRGGKGGKKGRHGGGRKTFNTILTDGKDGKSYALAKNGTAVIERRGNLPDIAINTIPPSDFAAWIEFLLRTGDYYYRGENPAFSEREKYIELALENYFTAIEWRNQNTFAQRRIESIFAGIHYLGAYADPGKKIGLAVSQRQYKEYLDALQVTGADYGELCATLLTYTTVENIKRVLEMIEAQVDAALSERKRELKEAQLVLEEDREAYQDEQRRSSSLLSQIENRKSYLESKSSSFFGQVANIYQVATTLGSAAASAVVGVGAITSFVPAVISFPGTFLDNAPGSVKAFFTGADNPHADKIDKAAGKFGKYGSRLSNGGQKVFDVVKLLSNAKGGDPEMERLLQEHIEQMHRLQLAERDFRRAERRVEMMGENVKAYENVLRKANGAVAAAGSDLQSLYRAALAVIRVLQEYITVAHISLMYAKRSLEIYTLRDVDEHCDFLAGFVHPDDEDRVRHGLTAQELGSLFKNSYRNRLKPLQLGIVFNEEFETGLHTSLIRRKIDSAPEIAILKSGGSLRFNIDVRDLAPGRYNEKVLNVEVAFGGLGDSETVDFRVIHSRRKEQRVKGGGVHTEYLDEDLKIDSALRVESITPRDFEPSEVPKYEGSSTLWGKGLGGEYFVFVEMSEMDPAVLSRIESCTLLISYSFRV